MYTIAGSGFGLYGYLPALVERLGERVILPRAYESKLRARPELSDYLGSIQWVDDTESALAMATGIVIATPPSIQPHIVAKCLRFARLERMVLEKPLAVTPSTAFEVIAALRLSGKRFRVGYTFLHTPWSSGLAWPRRGQPDERVTISWTFMAHHFSKALVTWKRRHAEGGGALRFYGMHLLALLARLGYCKAERSVLCGEDRGDPEQWRCLFSGPGVPPCGVELDSRSPTGSFLVTTGRGGGARMALVDLEDPFQGSAQPAQIGTADRRIDVLKHLLDSFSSADDACYDLYDRVNALWRDVETISTFEAPQR